MNTNYPLMGELELNFYFSDGRFSGERFHEFPLAITSLGVEITGGRSLPDWTLISMTTQEFKRNVKLQELRFGTFYITTPMGLALPGYSDAVSMLREFIPQELRETVSPPITIRSNYIGVFDTSSSPRNLTPEIASAGKKVFDFFVEVVKLLKPAYASISADRGLPTPEELKLDLSRSYAFRNFYVDENYIGSEKIGWIIQLYSGAYVEYLDRGVYISCSSIFNPKQIWLGWDVELLNQYREVGKMIAERG